MKRKLSHEDVAPAMMGGLLLSAGGSSKARSLERHDLAAAVALDYADLAFVSIDELPQDGWLLISTSVGAPGFAQPELVLRDHVRAAEVLIEKVGSRPAGVICGHVPGMNGWLVAAALGLPYVDAAANGRGHPTVEMGGMGLASRPTVHITQVAEGGYHDTGSRLSMAVEGNLQKTSYLMRQASVVSGGLVASARGPFPVDFVAENGAAGAISFQIGLGQAMLAASPGAMRIRAAADFMQGQVLVTGKVVENTVAYGGGYDAGRITVSDGETKVTLGIFNEFMTADIGGQRVATFPDMLGALDPESGDPMAIAEMPLGTPVAIVAAHRDGFPLGQGALDPAVFHEVEKALGAELFSYL